MERRLSKKGKEVLAILAGGADLEFRRSPQGYFCAAGKDRALWTKYHRKTLLYAIHAFHKHGFAEIHESEEGLTKVKLTDAGKSFARKQQSVLGGKKPNEWDKKWRLVFFDVPEEKKKERDAFRYQLRKAGLMEFQRSAFVYPYPCFREVGTLADELGVKEHIVLVTAETLSNEFKFKEHFGLV